MPKFKDIKAGTLFKNADDLKFKKKNKKQATSLEESLFYKLDQVVKFEEDAFVIAVVRESYEEHYQRHHS